MLQQGKVLVTKPKDLGLIPRTHIVEGKNWLPQISTLPSDIHTYICSGTYMYI